MPRLGERVGIDFHHGVHARSALIEIENAAEVFARKCFGSHMPRGHLSLQLRDGEVLVTAPRGGARLGLHGERQKKEKERGCGDTRRHGWYSPCCPSLGNAYARPSIFVSAFRGRELCAATERE